MVKSGRNITINLTIYKKRLQAYLQAKALHFINQKKNSVLLIFVQLGPTSK